MPIPIWAYEAAGSMATEPTETAKPIAVISFFMILTCWLLGTSGHLQNGDPDLLSAIAFQQVPYTGYKSICLMHKTVATRRR
jgi:hypothetical protein